MEGSKTLFCSSKYPWARERIYSIFIENLDTHPQKTFANPGLGSDGTVDLFRSCYNGHISIFAPVCTLCVSYLAGQRLLVQILLCGKLSSLLLCTS
jgi:hypothetical protein